MEWTSVNRYRFVLGRGRGASIEWEHALLVLSMVYSDAKTWRGSFQNEVTFEKHDHLYPQMSPQNWHKRFYLVKYYWITQVLAWLNCSTFFQTYRIMSLGVLCLFTCFENCCVLLMKYTVENKPNCKKRFIKFKIWKHQIAHSYITQAKDAV